ncbi:hypothetical protein HA052_22130 [Chromobacterium haemolyticum]|uniref:Transcriptional regulator n=1 Tax=Chromobacterium fluminis TaxID=3044269 RepID=A0ABX0LAT5_9NEIS|nr:hypothetical protein [Chromobacterium haemolyticum]NHR07895.1 hypothetical protein [Chromobacterium haemolyticum]
MKSNHPPEVSRATNDETGAALHGGARPGAGRKASKNPTKSGSIRLTQERWDKLRALGMEWLSNQIDAATLPESGRK